MPNRETKKTYSAFYDDRLLATGSLPDVARKIKRALQQKASGRLLIFDDSTGRELDINLQGTEEDVVARLLQSSSPSDLASQEESDRERTAPPRGRPKLGVVAREVTLLPRHWEWLNVQPGGASVSLRKLVEDARRQNSDKDRHRAARETAYHFMSAMGGNLPDFEEAARALFRGDHAGFISNLKRWPADIRKHAITLAQAQGPLRSVRSLS